MKKPRLVPSPPRPSPRRPLSHPEKLISVVSCATTTRRPRQARAVRSAASSKIACGVTRSEPRNRWAPTSAARSAPNFRTTSEPDFVTSSSIFSNRRETRISPQKPTPIMASPNTDEALESKSSFPRQRKRLKCVNAVGDAVRVMARLLKAADALVGGLVWRNHPRAAKKRARAIEFTRGRPNRVPHYRELIKLTQATLAYADQAATQLSQASDPMAAALWQAEFRQYRPLIERIIAQTERRVLRGEAVAANEKIVSLFEPHADIIVKGGREVQYGHKLNLTTGRSGLILDLVIEAGNPADSERFLPMLNRHIGFYGDAPRQTAADGGFASRHNLGEAKALGVRDVAFHKKAGLRVMDMVKSK